MNIRHPVLALLLIGVLLLILAPTSRVSNEVAHAAEPDIRATPTPVHPLSEPLPSPAEIEASGAPLPDLIVSDIRINPNPPLVGRLVTIDVTIQNVGVAPVPPGNNFFVDLYLNPETPPRACLPGSYFWAVQSFEMDSGSTRLRIELDPERDPRAAVFNDVGIITIWAQVDTAFDSANNRCGNVVESREDNNLRSMAVDITTKDLWRQTSPEEFQAGFSSALDLTHPLGVLQNGTGWFDEPRFPQPEDPAWQVNPVEPWNSSTFYNPDLHIETDNIPDDFPRDLLQSYNPPDQEHVDVEIGFEANVLYATWEDARHGDLTDRDIYFAYSNDYGKTWSAPIRVNHPTLRDTDGNYESDGSNQLKPVLVIDRVGRRLFVFWQDNRLGNYDIFFARSTDLGLTWEEPAHVDPQDPSTSNAINPINDFNVDSDADQVNVTAGAYNEEECTRDPNTGDWECTPGLTHLYVAWEDYRNGNADIFFEWSQDNGDTWLKSNDNDPTTIDANTHVAPDPVTNAGIFDQRNPHIFLERASSEAPINYCVTRLTKNIYYKEDGTVDFESLHYYPQNPLPKVFIAWEDERDIIQGDASAIYYTRGDFNYSLPPNAIRDRDGDGDLDPEPENCENNSPRPARHRENLPPFRFEDDHLRVSGRGGTARNPTGGFNPASFIGKQFGQQYIAGFAEYNYFCEVRYRTSELVIAWEDDRDGTLDIWATNIYDDIDPTPIYAYILEEDDEEGITGPPPFALGFPSIGCRGDTQNPPGIGENIAPTDPPEDLRLKRNLTNAELQPLERFSELTYPEPDIKISDGLTFVAKPFCQAPNEPPAYSREPSNQFNPDLAVLEVDTNLINQNKDRRSQRFVVDNFWTVWADSISLDAVNQDIFLRPAFRLDISRTLSIHDERGYALPLQTVQDNTKNQIVLRSLDVFDEFQPPNVQQANPSISFFGFELPDDDGNPLTVPPHDFELFVGWDDNRNANPFLGYEGNKDVFAARMRLVDGAVAGPLNPLTTASYVSPVFDAGFPAIWYDIDWWGDISADGILTFQTRFGLDPSKPEPPQSNIAENGWTQWTGVGGAGGAYTAPGQHIRGADGTKLPRSTYIQYRVNFNPAGGGQDGIFCISEVRLNYEIEANILFLPVMRR